MCPVVRDARKDHQRPPVPRFCRNPAPKFPQEFLLGRHERPVCLGNLLEVGNSTERGSQHHRDGGRLGGAVEMYSETCHPEAKNSSVTVTIFWGHFSKKCPQNKYPSRLWIFVTGTRAIGAPWRNSIFYDVARYRARISVTCIILVMYSFALSCILYSLTAYPINRVTVNFLVLYLVGK